MLTEININDEIIFNVNGVTLNYRVIAFYEKDTLEKLYYIHNGKYNHVEIFQLLKIIDIEKFCHNIYKHGKLVKYGTFPKTNNLKNILLLINELYKLIEHVK